MTESEPAKIDTLTTPKILIVEDETVFAKAVKKRLTKDGYNCHHCIDLDSADLALGQVEPDLILLDMRLPDGSGLDFLTMLREERGICSTRGCDGPLTARSKMLLPQ